MENNRHDTDNKYIVPAAEQAVQLLLCLVESPSSNMGLKEISAQVGIHKSKAFSILHTLEKFGLIQKNAGRMGYSLGLGLIALSRKVLDTFNAPRLAEPILQELATRSGCTAIMGLIAGKNVFVASKREAGSDIGVTVGIGRRYPLTYGSHGKAIAAALGEEELTKLLEDESLYFHGEPAKFDKARLQEELSACRRDGFALDLGEVRPWLNTVAAAVLGPDEIPVGYIVLMGLFSAETTRGLGPSVAEAAKTLSRQMGSRI